MGQRIEVVLSADVADRVKALGIELYGGEPLGFNQAAAVVLENAVKPKGKRKASAVKVTSES